MSVAWDIRTMDYDLPEDDDPPDDLWQPFAGLEAVESDVCVQTTEDLLGVRVTPEMWQDQCQNVLDAWFGLDANSRWNRLRDHMLVDTVANSGVPVSQRVALWGMWLEFITVGARHHGVTIG